MDYVISVKDFVQYMKSIGGTIDLEEFNASDGFYSLLENLSKILRDLELVTSPSTGTGTDIENCFSVTESLIELLVARVINSVHRLDFKKENQQENNNHYPQNRLVILLHLALECLKNLHDELVSMQKISTSETASRVLKYLYDKCKEKNTKDSLLQIVEHENNWGLGIGYTKLKTNTTYPHDLYGLEDERVQYWCKEDQKLISLEKPPTQILHKDTINLAKSLLSLLV